MDKEDLEMVGRYVASLFCVLGHLFPVFHGFRGGKGVAATMGILGILDWRLGLICLAVFLITISCSRMVSLGSVLAMFCVPVLTFVFRYWADSMPIGEVVFYTVSSGLVAMLVVIKHSANIRRIINGTENRLGQKSPAKTDSETKE